MIGLFGLSRIGIRFAAAAALVCAFVGNGMAWAGPHDDTLRISLTRAPEMLDPYFNNIREGVILAHHVWDHLIERDPDSGQYLPSLAQSWRWIDERTLEFDLRDGIEFHNGEPFDADDVVYTLQFVSNPANRVITQGNVNWIERVEKTGRLGVRITTRRPFPAALEYLAGPVVIFPDQYYAAAGPSGMSARPVGTGPYRVTEQQPGRQVRLERNDRYFAQAPRTKPAIRRIDIRFLPDPNTQIAELLAGGLDWIWQVSPDQVQGIGAHPRLTITSAETMRVAYLRVHRNAASPAPALGDRRVRQAILHAIDRETLAQQLVGPGSRVLHAACFPTQFGCVSSGIPQYPYDPERARALLAEAGYPDGFDIDLFAYRDRVQTEAVIGYLRAAGIRANLRFMNYAALRELARSNRAPFEHQTWGSYSIQDVSAITSVFFNGGEDDVTHDVEVTAAIHEGDSSVDPQIRQAAYRRALHRIAEQAYWLPLYSLTAVYAHSRELDFKPWPDELPRFWQARWR